MTTPWRRLPLLAIVAVAGGCGHDDGLAPPPAPARLAFTAQPTLIEQGRLLTPALTVEVQDAAGRLVRSSAAPVTIVLSNHPGPAHLSGTATVVAVGGIATFTDLALDGTGVGYVLGASSGTLDSAVAAPLDVVLPFVQIAPGAFFTCGLTVAGRAYCWGDGDFLGDGSGTDRAIPRPVAGNHVFTAISSGYYSCGLETGGAVYCWGADPPVLESAGYHFAALETGNLHSCALTAAGEAYCWGSNLDGQLGDSTLVDHVDPAPVLTSLRFQAISVGAWHACGLTASQQAYCWGYNGTGALGDGTIITRTTPVPVLGGITFASISAGRYHTCGIATGGETYCWGKNGKGELGDGSTTGSAVPVQVQGGVSLVSVSAGGEQTCGLTRGGAAYCWGFNPFGNLGDGTQVNRLTPTPVLTDVRFSSLPVGINQHNCGLRAAGAAFCWGLGSSGQLGNGLPYFLPRPSPVLNP